MSSGKTVTLFIGKEKRFCTLWCTSVFEPYELERLASSAQRNGLMVNISKMEHEIYTSK